MQQLLNLIYVTVLLCCCIIGATATPLSASRETTEASAAEHLTKQQQSLDYFGEDDDDDYPLNYNIFGTDLTDIITTRRITNDNHWDVLIFTQQWPVTTCYHWREHDPNHECTLPQKKEFWTIHGVWPTKLGHIGPNFCNKSADFNEGQLQTISERLETYWPDLEGERNAVNELWKHEWLKHGTCAALLDTLDDELKYFGQGLNWRDKYIMSRILDASDIHPDSNNTVIALNNAVVKFTGKNPSIHCLFDGKNGISYLSEIRICFNKSMELIDCDGVKRGDTVSINYPGGTVTTNCHISSPVHYPSLVPPVQRNEEWKFPLVNFYKLLQFLIWFTL